MNSSSRRQFLCACASLITAPIAAATGRTLPANLSGVIHATDPGAERLVVYNRVTGEEMSLVESVCVKEGWLKRYVVHHDADGRPDHLVRDENDNIFLERVEGPWAIRPGRLKTSPFHRRTAEVTPQDSDRCPS